ncbi:helix-turn-helix domain-containing protein [Nocardia takedensis]
MTRPDPNTRTNAAGLPIETREMLRTLGNAALHLADGSRVASGALHAGGPILDLGSSTALLTIPEACSRLRLSRWSLYQLINNRELATVKIGRRRFVPATEAQRFLDDLTTVGGRS